MSARNSILHRLYWILLLLLSSKAAKNALLLSQTHRISTSATNSEFLQYDCLQYNVLNKIVVYDGEESRGIISYCMRPYVASNFLEKRNGSILVINSFEHLQEKGVREEELLQWSTPLDLIELYLEYIEKPDVFYSVTNQFLFNCTPLWFGPHCEYTFSMGNLSFDDIVIATFQAKTPSFPFREETLNPLDYTNLTCYIHLTCDRGPGLADCLDWREVCDGKLDCVGEGEDERDCFQMEVNECAENEYRCHNGMCVPAVFFRDNRFNPDCLDSTDEFVYDYVNCFHDPTFRCEEADHPFHQIKDELTKDFVCGDGQRTISPFVSSSEHKMSCKNGRHLLMWNELYSREANSHLEYDCWLLLYCAIYAPRSKDCEVVCKNNSWNLCVVTPDSKCPNDEPLLFPAYPVLEGHIRFMYSPNQMVYSTQGITNFLGSLPDYVCFDEERSPFPFFTEFIHGLPCIGSEYSSMSDYLQITSIAELIALSRASLSSANTKDNDSHCHHSSLFHCPNSNKCISKHRLLDGHPDCDEGTDETAYNESCALNDHFRLQCISEKKCLSPMVIRNGEKQCSGGEDEGTTITNQTDRKEFSFQQLCNGYQHLEPVFIDGQYNETDETHCDEWPCDNIYTRCDGGWNCPNGTDEHHCGEPPCSHDRHRCLSAVNRTLICLPYERVNDGDVDCIGASDERQYCRVWGYSPDIRYRCQNTMECVDSRFICYVPGGGYYCRFDRKFDCSDKMVSNILSSITDITLSELKYIHFHLQNPVVEKLSSSIPNESVQQTVPQKQPLFEVDYRRAWLCNRGILVFVGIEKEERCLCPPSYYGYRCQFQSQRVSLTLQFERICAPDCRGTFAVVINLLEDDSQQLHSHEQILYSSTRDCAQKFNVYLLYASKPKNFSKYYVRVDMYNKIDLTHYYSRILSIPFLFLPVNRIAARIVIPGSPSQPCTLSCGSHGHCTRAFKDTNEFFFCRCDSGWSGVHCMIPYKCNCSSDAICVSPSVCVCPLHKRGSRCYLSSTCRFNPCRNGGLCIPNGEKLFEDEFTCICRDGFSGNRCEMIDTRIDISFTGDMTIPQLLLAHFITVQQKSEPTNIIVARKIPFDQEMAILYMNLPFHLIFVEIGIDFYVALVQEIYRPSMHIVSQVTPSHRCPHIRELMSVEADYPLLRRVKYYHMPCRERSNLMCFRDNSAEFMCLCTRDRHANCFEFNFNQTHDCHRNLNGCENGGKCYQGRACPTSIVCVCPECYYGAKCQFSTQGMTLSLDIILGYQIRRGLSIALQPVSVKVSIILTTVIVLFGLISGSLSTLTFRTRTTREVGCGIYLLASSILSIVTTLVFAYKFVSLLLTQTSLITNRTALRFNCIFIDFMIRSLVAVIDWLAAAVAIERALSAVKGIYFNKKKSRTVARWIIVIIIFSTCLNLVHDPLHRQLVDDTQEERTWCYVRYSSTLNFYDSAITIIHFAVPFAINCVSAFTIVVAVSKKRSAAQNKRSYKEHLRSQLHFHKHLLISPVVLIIIGAPRLVLTFTSGCMKSGRDPWLFLMGYFVSFTPSLLTFIIFVQPSDMYKKAFYNTINHKSMIIRRWLRRE